MAAGTLPAPGTEYGPCVGDCSHRDCAKTRKDAASVCPLCEEPIGYETPYYVDDDKSLVHARCLEARIVREHEAADRAYQILHPQG